MTIQVEISPESKGRLQAEARARGMAVEQYASRLLQVALSSSATGHGPLTVERFRGMLTALAENSEGLPDVPTEGFSRGSFYEGRRADSYV